ncbi:MAG: hypothetical protein JST80_09155 [Bdellovibrionales bacterium]|nr:hypothetical protein [Bdellovibrionales bacterium]
MIATLFSLALLVSQPSHADMAGADYVGTPEEKMTIVLFAKDIRDETARANGKIPYQNAKAIEALFYHSAWFMKAIHDRANYEIPLTGSRLYYSQTDVSLHYERGNINLVRRSDEQPNMTTSQIAKIENDIFDQVLGSRGYQSQYLVENHPVTVDSDNSPQELKLTVAEKWVDKGQFEGSKWEYLPVRLLSWPTQKILYEIPTMLTSTVTESFMRSPGQNLAGTADEFKGAGKLFLNGVKDMGLGIAHPGRARFFDGALELLDMSVKIGSAGLGVIKSAVSVVAYPIYRLFGGKKSQRVALKGKRAVIVLVDSGFGMAVPDGMVDTYGESIVRAKLKSISDYYCIRTNAEPNNINKCIDAMPSNIQYLDIVSLQHSGGIDESEQFARYAQSTKGVRIELLLSIGCYDNPSAFVQGENALGQKKTSWAVHFYLANMLEKRLRGIPADQAANQAWGEGFAANAIDPLSWGGVIAVGIMEGNLKDGYGGSKPNLITVDTIVEANIARVQSKALKTPEEKEAMRLFFAKVRDMVQTKKISLKHKTLRHLSAAEESLKAS